MNPEPTQRSQIGQALKETQLGFRHLIRSELRLASAELREGATGAAKGSVRIVAFSAVLLWTIPFLTAFLIIGLGNILNHQYWLSALLLAVTTALIGGIGLKSSLKSDRFKGLTLPRTRRTISREARDLREMEKAA